MGSLENIIRDILQESTKDILSISDQVKVILAIIYLAKKNDPEKKLTEDIVVNVNPDKAYKLSKLLKYPEIPIYSKVLSSEFIEYLIEQDWDFSSLLS